MNHQEALEKVTYVANNAGHAVPRHVVRKVPDLHVLVGYTRGRKHPAIVAVYSYLDHPGNAYCGISNEEAEAIAQDWLVEQGVIGDATVAADFILRHDGLAMRLDPETGELS